MLTRLVSLQQGNVKKSEKLMKIVNIEKEMRNFNEIFGKDVTYENIKSHKKQGFNLPLKNTFLEKSYEVCVCVCVCVGGEVALGLKIQESVDLVTFTEEILNGKLHFVGSEYLLCYVS